MGLDEIARYYQRAIGVGTQVIDGSFQVGDLVLTVREPKLYPPDQRPYMPPLLAYWRCEGCGYQWYSTPINRDADLRHATQWAALVKAQHKACPKPEESAVFRQVRDLLGNISEE